MAKMTLLELTQSILSSMDSDAVNSISDTIESAQVAEEIKTAYFQMVTDRIVPEHKELFKLTALGSSTYPNYLQYPTDLDELIWWKYNKKETGATDENFEDVTWLEPEDFVDLVSKRKSSDSNVSSIADITGATTLLIRTDRAPQYWTSFDDEYIVCDSYDSAVESSLVASKTLCYGRVLPTWTVSDSFTPDLDANLFPFLLAKAKATCFVNLKQSQNPKLERQERDQKVRWQNDRYRNRKQNRAPDGPNFGRRGF